MTEESIQDALDIAAALQDKHNAQIERLGNTRQSLFDDYPRSHEKINAQYMQQMKLLEDGHLRQCQRLREVQVEKPTQQQLQFRREMAERRDQEFKQWDAAHDQMKLHIRVQLQDEELRQEVVSRLQELLRIESAASSETIELAAEPAGDMVASQQRRQEEAATPQQQVTSAKEADRPEFQHQSLTPEDLSALRDRIRNFQEILDLVESSETPERTTEPAAKP